MQSTITPDVLKAAMSFDEYLQFTRDILSKSMDGGEMYKNESTFRYTQSNLDRMNKVLEFMVVQQKLYNLLSDLKEQWWWVLITEPWCGDAAWSTPALYMIASCSDKIDFRILLRDSHPEVIRQYHTNGGGAIPKLVCLRAGDLAEIGTWGPRPQVLQEQVVRFKEAADFDFKESVRKVHQWYEEDKSNTLQEEMIERVKAWIGSKGQ